MCQKIIFNYNNQILRVAYNDVQRQLPILTKKGDTTLLPWGRSRLIPGHLPMTNFISLKDIYAGQWDEYFPIPVKLPVKAFQVRDTQQNLKWFHLTSDKWIQGLVAHFKKERCVYIVTLAQTQTSIYPHWPRILLGTLC